MNRSKMISFGQFGRVMKRLLVALGFCSLGLASFADVPEWVVHYEWAKNNHHGSEPHDAAIAVLAPDCFLTGKHPSCLFRVARDSAKANNCERALQVLKEAQGHNGRAQDLFQQASASVCARLKAE